MVDTIGNLWLAVWNMGCVMCLSPEGKLIETIKLAANKPTSVAFGGNKAQYLFVTSASENTNTHQNQQGNVFKITGIKNGQFEPSVVI